MSTEYRVTELNVARTGRISPCGPCSRLAYKLSLVQQKVLYFTLVQMQYIL